MKENRKYIVVLLVFLSLSPLEVNAQEPPEPRMQESPPPPPPPGLPIDDYLPLLGIAGIAYGAYLSRKLQKNATS